MNSFLLVQFWTSTHLCSKDYKQLSYRFGTTHCTIMDGLETSNALIVHLASTGNQMVQFDFLAFRSAKFSGYNACTLFVTWKWYLMKSKSTYRALYNYYKTNHFAVYSSRICCFCSFHLRVHFVANIAVAILSVQRHICLFQLEYVTYIFAWSGYSSGCYHFRFITGDWLFLLFCRWGWG